MQLDFFQTEAAAAAQKIPGLILFPDFISQERADDLVRFVDSQSWTEDGKRRVQHYGYTHEIKRSAMDESHKVGDDELPEPFQVLARKFRAMKFMPELADQVTVAEYKPGVGVSGHIDCEKCYTDGIVTISLLSDVVMNFDEVPSKKRVPLLLAPRSVLVLKGKSRFNWKHAIPSRKTDSFASAKFTRERRISITFRKVVLGGEEGSEE